MIAIREGIGRCLPVADIYLASKSTGRCDFGLCQNMFVGNDGFYQLYSFGRVEILAYGGIVDMS